MTRGLSTDHPIRNRRHDTVSILTIAPIEPADLALLHLRPARMRITRIKDSHHRIARMMAAGESNTNIAAQCGISMSGLATLRADPTIIELTNQYRAEVASAWREHVDALAELAVTNLVKAERQISDALDEADETATPIPLRELSRITADRMDRFGYGKHNTVTNVNVDFAKRLDAAITRSRQSLPSTDPN
jgi:hypothetical protein